MFATCLHCLTMVTLKAEKAVVSTAWKLEKQPSAYIGAPGWTKNPSSKASVKKYKKGLVFLIPESGKEYRWKVNIGKVDLKKYQYIRISYRAVRVDHSKRGGYILYTSTADKQKLYPLNSSQLTVNSSLQGEVHEMTVNVGGALKGNAAINRLIIGLKAASANAQLYIEDLRFFSDREIAPVKYIELKSGRSIEEAEKKGENEFKFMSDVGVPVTKVPGWSNNKVRGAELTTPEKDNILYNGGFENVKSGKLNGWGYEFRDGAAGTVEFDDSFSRNGKRSLKINKTNGKGYILVFSEKAIPVKDGDKYAFQGFYHTRNVKDSQRTLGMVRLTQDISDLGYNRSVDKWNGLRTQQYMINAKKNQWHKRVVNLKIEKGKLPRLHVCIIIYGNPATVWWDDMAVEPLSLAWKRWFASNPRSIDYFKPEQITDKEFRKALNTDIDHTAELKNINGKSALLVDGKLTPPVIFRGGGLSPQNYTGGPLDKAGVRLQIQVCKFGPSSNEDVQVTPGKVNRKLVPGIYVGKGKFNFTTSIRNLEIAMKASPNSLFLLGLDISSYDRYVNDNPSEAWMNAKGQKAYGTTIHLMGFADKLPAGRFLWPSYFSRKWRDDMTKAMCLFLDKLKKTGLAKRIIGIHIGGGHDGQFAMRQRDYNPHAIAAFRNYLRKKYRNLSALKKAWNNPVVTFANASIPIKTRDVHRFLDPAENTDCYDYWRFAQSEILKLQEGFARAAKKVLGKKVLAVKSLMSTHGGSYVSTYSLNQLLKSDVFDIGSPQAPYYKREPGINYCFPQPLLSYNLHTKLLVAEFDIRTYFRCRYDEVKTGRLGRMESFKMWQAGLRKLTGQMIAGNQGYWFLDLHWGWFQKEIAKDIGDDHRVYSRIYPVEINQKEPKRTDLLVVLDEESLYWTSIGSRQYILETILNTYNQLYSITNSGVPFDYVMLEDLIAHPELVDRYKVFVFNHSYRLDKQRIKIYEKLKNNKRTLVWLYAAGFVGQKSRSVESMKKLTGINIKYLTGGIDHSIVTLRSQSPLSFGLSEKQDTASVEKAAGDLTLPVKSQRYYHGPYFFVDDPGVQMLAKYQQTGQGAIAVKKFPAWTSVYVASPGGLSPELLNNICRDAGAYVCSRPGVDLFLNDNFISIHGIVPGYYTFTLPRKCNVRNLFNGKIIVRNTNIIQMWVEPQTTYWLGIE